MLTRVAGRWLCPCATGLGIDPWVTEFIAGWLEFIIAMDSSAPPASAPQRPSENVPQRQLAGKHSDPQMEPEVKVGVSHQAGEGSILGHT